MAILSEQQYSEIFPLNAAIGLTASLRFSGTEKDRFEHISKPLKERFFDFESWRNRIFERHSNLAHMMTTGYFLAKKFNNLAEAKKRLKAADRVLTIGKSKYGHINLSCSDDELIEIAEQKARYCELKIIKHGYQLSIYQLLSEYLTSFNIQPTELISPYCTNLSADSLKGALNRFADPIFWRRKLRKIQAFTIEQLARDLRLVHKKASAYVSQHTIQNRRERKRNSAEIMSNLFVVPDGANPFDEFDTLQSIIERSHTSGKQQAAELMVRIRGFEELADMHGHRGEFYTLSAPSRYHAVHHTGIPNNKYDGSTPQQAQEYFNGIWKRARALFSKQNLRPYGFRVVEPHHDGCPHWHMLLFMEKGDAIQVRAILRKLCTEDTPTEFRTSKTRFKPIRIIKSKGSAAGYIAKYITKAVTGDSIDKVICSQGGEMKILPADAAERASTWASTFDIRRFQQIGGPSVTLWRELRRLGQGDTGKCEVANAMNTTLDTVSKYALEKVRHAADSSDWKAFCLAMGGVQVKRKEQTLRIHYQIPDIVDRITGEISRSESKSPYFATKYGDQPANRILGVAWDSIVVITRRGTTQILTETDLKAQRKIMCGVSEQIQGWHDDGRLFSPSEEDMQFLESCAIEDYQNMCLFMDYEALASNVSSDEVAPLDLCH
ncbi:MULTISPECIES: replication endonuclease [unclassified Pseudoalteromonas]|uniref:replication endonuclease n=1 Tax=unclassified Pseudoalteromonas TaxID=194690 RepID=UPI002358149A|nr:MULTISPECIES: replication endonuclease [unclassified Pseudoalteromonas]MDC9497257.1 replication endonuclease [Pseudoalteromonas sp. Angola-20]MDC9517710.1 replication endonuclease [Pseudoalteromonas sp. Angola-22]MDC9534021.1 replication endonuclease [Pseudoalteromonas sp. Angola-9]